VKDFENQFYRFLETEKPEILKNLGESNALSDEIRKGLDEALTAFRESFLA
jgi:F-type H+-transporting ATPase subunit alpha